MEINEKLELFLDILNCSHPINLWEYTMDLEPVRSFTDNPRFMKDILKALKIEDILKAGIQEDPRRPLFVENRLGLIFLCSCAYKSERPSLYILGPAFSGADSLSSFKELLESSGLSLGRQYESLEVIREIPIISSVSLMQYAVTLHYLVNGEHIDMNEIEFYSTFEKKSKESLEKITKEHRGIYEGEKSFLRLIREGNPDYVKALQRMTRLSGGMRVSEGNPVRNAKNNFLVLLTLISRASIEGGLNPEISYNLNDYYASRMEICSSVADVARLSQEMMEDYTARNRIQRKNNGISRPIQAACDYIALNLRTEIRISDLAKNAGYTDYYFSHRFKEETGETVTEYIRRKKIEESKLLLIDSQMSINEIWEELAFGSRNSFFQSFKKLTGISPSEYRRRWGQAEERD